MIIPTHCKSCGKPIGHLWFNYLERVKKYQESNTPADQDQEEDELDEFPNNGPSPNDTRTPEARALDELLLHKSCCRLMFICQPIELVTRLRNRIEN